jgi:hypothetical protein
MNIPFTACGVSKMMTGISAACGWRLWGKRCPLPKPLVSLLVGVALAGCGEEGGSTGPAVYPVSGVVKLNGQPVVGADIVFALKEGTGSSFGRTDANGKYQLTTRKSNDGAPPGDYLVSISKVEDAPATDSASVPQDSPNYNPYVGKAAPAKPKAKTGIPAQYGDAKTSGLTARVAEEKTTIDFDLK